MKKIITIEQIEDGSKWLWFKERPDQLDISQFKIPTTWSAEKYFKIKRKIFGWWTGIMLSSICLWGIVYYFLKTDINYMPLIISWSFLIFIWSTQILFYKQIGIFKVNKPHQFKEEQEVKIKIKDDKIVEVKPR